MSRVSNGVWTYVGIVAVVAMLLFAADADDTARSAVSTAVRVPFEFIGAVIDEVPNIGGYLDGTGTPDPAEPAPAPTTTGENGTVTV